MLGPRGTDSYLGVGRIDRVDRPLTVDEQTAIHHALTVLSIDAAHREALRQTHRRHRIRRPAIARRMRGLGLEPHGRLVAIMCDRPDADARLGRFEDALAAAGLHAVATARAGRLVAVAECDPKAPTDALCAELATAIGRESAVGIGAPVAHCALLAQQDPDVLEHSCRQLLHPLAKRDAARGSELLPTLAAFLASGGRWVRTADELHIHVNTLRHRLARVEALTGRSLDDPDDRVDFHLALRATARAGGASG